MSQPGADRSAAVAGGIVPDQRRYARAPGGQAFVAPLQVDGGKIAHREVVDEAQQRAVAGRGLGV